MEGINLYSIDYYKKTVFKGSYRGLCFRIARAEIESGAEAFSEGEADGSVVLAETIPVLRVQAWKGPYVLEKTSEEVFTEDFEYTNDGLNEANEWLEEKQREIIGHNN